jgi:hypothetical protein
MSPKKPSRKRKVKDVGPAASGSRPIPSDEAGQPARARAAGKKGGEPWETTATSRAASADKGSAGSRGPARDRSRPATPAAGKAEPGAATRRRAGTARKTGTTRASRRASGRKAPAPVPAATVEPSPAATAEPSPLPELEPAEPPVLGNIPWGYGDNRVTAMAIDPYWLFVYWEVTDDAIARAQAEVQAPGAACVLRVYDTTYRLFDGTNANWYMDVAVHRPANNHYVRAEHPGSTFHVDIGVKSYEGHFATIARSAPVEMPRDSISLDTRADWMTVTPATGLPREYQHRLIPRAGPPAPEPVAQIAPGPEIEQIMHALAGEGWSRTEWSEADMGGRIVRWVRWFGPAVRASWLPADGDYAHVEILFEGEQRRIRVQGAERVVLGPWMVTIRGLAPEGGQRIVDRWAIHYAWATAGGGAAVQTAPIVQRILQGYRSLAVTGSEARLMEASWASESLQMGASEWRWLGGSEAWLGGASEIVQAGASEVSYLGASERLALGASEAVRAGAMASESRWLGASESLQMGASESRP